MAVYRHVHTSFWQDAFVIDLTPEEKYFYLYILTNPKAAQCGVYEISYKIMEMETGYNRETVEKLIERFVQYGKIKYSSETKELLILNWAKFNVTKSPKVLACIEKELETIKNQEFKCFAKKNIYQIIGKSTDSAPTEKNSIGYAYPMDTLSIDYGEKEKEKEKPSSNEEDEFLNILNKTNHWPVDETLSRKLYRHIAVQYKDLDINAILTSWTLQDISNLTKSNATTRLLKWFNACKKNAHKAIESPFNNKSITSIPWTPPEYHKEPTKTWKDFTQDEAIKFIENLPRFMRSKTEALKVFSLKYGLKPFEPLL